MTDVASKANTAATVGVPTSWGTGDWRGFLVSVCAELDSRLFETKELRIKVAKKKASGKATGFESDGAAADQVTFKAPDTSGACCVLTLVTSTHIFVANLGDCRCIVAAESPTGLAATPLSFDHAVSKNEEEKKRLQMKGGVVVKVTGDGIVPDFAAGTHVQAHGETIAISRGFGDFAYKVDRNRSTPNSVVLLPPADQIISSLPEVQVRLRSDLDCFLLLACDGVYDVMSNKDCVNLVLKKLGADRSSWSPGSLARSCDQLLKECLARKSNDNMSALLVHLGRPPPLSSLPIAAVASTQPSILTQQQQQPPPPQQSSIPQAVRKNLEYSPQVTHTPPSKVEILSSNLSKIAISGGMAQPEFSHLVNSSVR
jgi:serine/threonine protein phosphatase PrpC